MMMTLSEARAEGRQAERERTRAVFAVAGARQNLELVTELLASDLTAAAIVAMLGKLPVAATARRTLMPHAPPSINLGPDSGEEPSNAYDRGRAAAARALGKRLD